MIHSVYTVAVQVWILFALIGVGVLARRFRMVTEEGARCLSDILVIIVAPCLMVDAFQRPFESSLLAQLGFSFVFALVSHVVLIALARAFFRAPNGSTPVLRLAMVFSNAGFMGIPLEQALFGSRGVFFGVVYVAMFNLFFWSWGILEMCGKRFSIRSLVNPALVGLLIALGLFLGNVRLPFILAEPVRLVSQLNAPLAMFVLGYYLAEARFGRVLTRPVAYVAAALRLLAAPLLLLLAFLPFRSGLDRTMMLSLVTGASAPVGVLVAVFAARERRDVDLGIALVCGTTLLSVLTMPLVIAFAMTVIPV